MSFGKIKYSDAELLSFLEENGKEASYKNLVTLKEGLRTGAIILEEDDPEEEPVDTKESDENEVDEKATEEKEEKKLVVENYKKVIPTLNKTSVQTQLMEMNGAKKTGAVLDSFLIEDCNMNPQTVRVLREDTKIASLKGIAIEILRAIEQKVLAIDTSSPDRSRGDIKQLKELDVIQTALSEIEAMIERDPNAMPEYKEATQTIIKTILYLNQFSNVFKDAYRNKKTLMIVRYESLILSIISSITYLLSVMIEVSDDNIVMRKKAPADVFDFGPMKTLQAFNASVESGEFKDIARDVNLLREFYLEIPVEKMGALLEANEFIPMVVDGIKNLYSNLTNGKLPSLLYKLAGYVVMIFSLRDSIYTLSKMKSKVSDSINALNTFTGLNLGGNALNKLSTFLNRFRNDALSSSHMTEREIESENRQFSNQVQSIQTRNILSDRDAKEEKEAPVDDVTEEDLSDLVFGDF